MENSQIISTGKIERNMDKKINKAIDTIDEISEEIGFKKSEEKISTVARDFSIDL